MDGWTCRCNPSHQFLCFISPWQTLYNLRHDKYFGGPFTRRRHATSKIIPSPLSQPTPHPPTFTSFHDSALPPSEYLSLCDKMQLLSHSGCLYPQTLQAVSCSHKCQNLSTLTLLHDGKLHLALSKMSLFFSSNPTRPNTLAHLLLSTVASPYLQ